MDLSWSDEWLLRLRGWAWRVGVFWSWLLVSVTAWLLVFYLDPPWAGFIKFVHVMVFFPWSLATMSLLRRMPAWIPNLWLEVIFCLAAAALIELSQLWIPDHAPDWIGYACNCLGVLLGAYVRWRLDLLRLAGFVPEPEDEAELEDEESTQNLTGPDPDAEVEGTRDRRDDRSGSAR